MPSKAPPRYARLQEKQYGIGDGKHQHGPICVLRDVRAIIFKGCLVGASAFPLGKAPASVPYEYIKYCSHPTCDKVLDFRRAGDAAAGAIPTFHSDDADDHYDARGMVDLLRWLDDARRAS